MYISTKSVVFIKFKCTNIFIDGVIGITEHLQVGNLITHPHHKIKESLFQT
jgi:hypothetical protein